MLLHATACSGFVSVSHCEATQAESKVFYQKMKAALTALTELGTGCTECLRHVCWTCFGDAWDMFWTCINHCHSWRECEFLPRIVRELFCVVDF